MSVIYYLRKTKRGAACQHPKDKDFNMSVPALVLSSFRFNRSVYTPSQLKAPGEQDILIRTIAQNTPLQQDSLHTVDMLRKRTLRPF